MRWEVYPELITRVITRIQEGKIQRRRWNHGAEIRERESDLKRKASLMALTTGKETLGKE